MLAGLGLGELQHDRRLGTLSGGQRGRLALAALLVRRPPALLLDEPTNHLDDAAAAFIEAELRGMPGVVVVARHDRAFLDAVCTDLIDLDPSVDGPVRYGGNYTAYQAQKRAERERWRRRYDEEQAELAQLRVAIEETAHQVAPGRLKRDNEKMGFGRTARDTYDLTLGPERAARIPLTDLGLLASGDLDTAVGRLSVGQRRRLALALLIADPAELLLLDEPANHLSPSLADELEHALGTTAGTTVLATHGRWLRTRWPHRELRL